MNFIRARSPSNIAFVKYWGKRDAARQWPANDSLSMTLNQLSTTTDAALIDAADHQFHFAGQLRARGEQRFSKAYTHLDHLAQRFGFSKKLVIHTHNNFPTGAGIASSASGLSALTLASLAAWTGARSFAELEAKDFDRNMLAQLARQGSGSAGRSLYGGYVQWNAGTSPESQSFIQLQDQDHWALADSVILFEKGEKSRSSTDAHADAWSSPLFRPRIAGISSRLERMRHALARKSIAELGPLLEDEALEMHAVIMTANPAQYYLSAKALQFLVDLREARRQGLFEAYFTIDAGPNIHIIHCQTETQRLRSWLEAKQGQGLLPESLHDTVGSGPSLEGCNRE